MLNSERVYMLAADHRWQWEEWCDARSVPRARIAEVKRIAFDGFRLAHSRSEAVREFGALLLDEQYAGAFVAEGVRAGLRVGTPVEKAGAYPLVWCTDPFTRALTGAFVKVLVRHRPDEAAAILAAQWMKLAELDGWCRTAGKPLVVEVLVPRRNEPDDAFETNGRPAMLAAFVAEAYARGLVPSFWKIEGTLSTSGARVIDRAVAEHPCGRQILLGKAADLATIDRWFAASASSATAAGFAIGRSVFWDPCTAFLSGTTSIAEATAEVCANYLHLVDRWQARPSSA